MSAAGLKPDTRKIAVAQPLPGIGDMIWHLPHIRAVSRHFDRPVTLIANSRSVADQIFKAEETLQDVLWLERRRTNGSGGHDGVAGFVRLISAIRARRFDMIVLLHHSRTLAFAAMCAGVPERLGYGIGLQRPFLNKGPFLSSAELRLHPFARASVWLKAAGVELAEKEPRLSISPDSDAKAMLRLGAVDPKPVALGIGSSERHKQWGAERFAELAAGLIQAGFTRIVLVGGKPDAVRAEEIQSRLGAKADNILLSIGWEISEVAALLSRSAFYVGNDTGFMNMAAAVGIPTFCLFGGTEPFRHSRNIVPITPPDGRPNKSDGMSRITTPMVLDTLRANLAFPSPSNSSYELT
jgi:heptosyltransferase-2